MQSTKKPRYLTKSRFKQALDCPTKLYYTKKKEYVNNQQTDTFLESLAQGGFQVEELARMNYPKGIAILGDDWDYELLTSKTQKLLTQENVTIFEAAFLIDGLFIRVDVLDKKGNNIQLIEVKAKSIKADEHDSFLNKKEQLSNGWTPYLYDVAFQKYVIQKCHPNWHIKAYLMLANKSATSTVDGLNQFFRISKKANLRTGIIKPDGLKLEDLGEPLVVKISVEEEVNLIQNTNPIDENKSFEELLNYFKNQYKEDIKIFTEIGRQCKACEFHTEPTETEKSGFHECWGAQLKITNSNINKPKVYDVSNYRKSDKLIAEGKFFMEEILENDIDIKPVAGKISPTERQWIQIEKVQLNDNTPYFELEGLRDELNSWEFPLNFIDFETSAVAIPFTKGRKPYEQLAFQYSHHIVYEDGRIEHASEYLNTQIGVFPNFDFIRALKASLEVNAGSIFRYHAHENTIVNAIYKQLLASEEPDKDELITFIKSISHNTGNSAENWCGDRDMIDLWKVVKDYYYDPYTNGSNSIKAVLPAVLFSSNFLQNKYQKPLSEINATSKNFEDAHVFLKLENGKPISPYKLLPPLFDGWDAEAFDNAITEIEGISDGGAALTAYGKLQFEEVSLQEREAIEAGLLKYCELDTLAMVMIYEYFKEVIN
ncbi:MAG: DUF2779 domain-containing protein [Maribacter arcticus]|uniref:DUF2779 domain-containing protein n=1 Tax=Maribacter arcticus TaxID=561365 RepID=UPI0030024FD3